MRAATAPPEPELVVFVGSGASEVFVEDGRLVEDGALDEVSSSRAVLLVVAAAGIVSDGPSVFTVVWIAALLSGTDVVAETLTLAASADVDGRRDLHVRREISRGRWWRRWCAWTTCGEGWATVVPTIVQRRRAASDFETNMMSVSDGDGEET